MTDARLTLAALDAPYRGPSESFADLCQLLRGAAPTFDYLFLGDSTFERLAHEDQDRRTLGCMLHDAFIPTGSARVISCSAYSARHFRSVLAAAGRLGWRAQAVIFILSLRSFGPIWMGMPQWQFQHQTRWLDAVADGADPITLPTPTADDAVDDTAFRNSHLNIKGAASSTMAEFQALLADHADDVKARRLCEIFTVYHCFSIANDHLMFDALRDTLDRARAMGTRIHAYLAPINVEAGERHVGWRFRRQVIENARAVRRALSPAIASGGLFLHDFSLDFSSRQFLRPDQPTEHLNDHGRRALVERLRQTVLHPAHAADAPPSIPVGPSP